MRANTHFHLTIGLSESILTIRKLKKMLPPSDEAVPELEVWFCDLLQTIHFVFLPDEKWPDEMTEVLNTIRTKFAQDVDCVIDYLIAAAPPAGLADDESESAGKRKIRP